jgi:cyanate lyase
MDVSVTTKELLDAKRAKGLTFAELGKIIGRDEVWVAALFYGQARADEDEAKKLVTTLELGEYIAEALTDHLPLLRDHAGLRNADEGGHP